MDIQQLSGHLYPIHAVGYSDSELVDGPRSVYSSQHAGLSHRALVRIPESFLAGKRRPGGQASENTRFQSRRGKLLRLARAVETFNVDATQPGFGIPIYHGERSQLGWLH